MSAKKVTAIPVKRGNLLWVLLLAILTTGGIAGLYLYPNLQALERDKQAIVSAETQLTEKKITLAELVEANKTPKINQLDILLNKQVPPQPEKTELIRYLDEISPYRQAVEGEKTLLKSFNLRDEQAVSTPGAEDARPVADYVVPGRIAIQGVLESSKEAFMGFLAELERTDKRLFTINQLSLNQAKGPQTQPSF